MAKQARKIQPPKPIEPQVPQGWVQAFLALIWVLRPGWRNSIVIVGVVFALGLAFWLAIPDRFREDLFSHLLNRNAQKLEANSASSNNQAAKDISPLTQNQQPSSETLSTNTQGGKGSNDITKPKQPANQIPSKAKDDEELFRKQSEDFFELLKNAKDKSDLRLYGAAYRDYLSASEIIPQRFRGKVKADLSRAAKLEYVKAKFSEAVELFEKAFQDVPRP